MPEALTCSEISKFLSRLIAACFPDPAFGLGGKFAPYLSLSRAAALQIFLKNRQETDLAITCLLAGPLEPAKIAQDLQSLSLDLQICLLDRLLYGNHWISRAEGHNAAKGRADQKYRFPEFLVAICTQRYQKDEVRRWLSSNSLPYIILLG